MINITIIIIIKNLNFLVLRMAFILRPRLPLSVPSRSFAGFPLDLIVFVLEEPSASTLLKHTGFENFLPEAIDDSVFGLVVAHYDLDVIRRFEVKRVGMSKWRVQYTLN